jgi:hypothetical protein
MSAIADSIREMQDQIAARDAEIARLRAALELIAGYVPWQSDYNGDHVALAEAALAGSATP